jgi:ATP-dependent RNA helicase RhlE
MQFSQLRLAEPLLSAIQSEGYVTATPIQAQAIPHALEGKDVLGIAQTGTGKTAAFALPIIQKLGTASDSSAFSRTSTSSVESRACSPSSTHESTATKVAGYTQKKQPRALILAPTRELATQIADSFRSYGRNYQLRNTVIFGGVNQNRQTDALRRGVDVIIATPGRLLDLMNQGCVDLRAIEVLVLDEADRMLDMGFIHDIRRITAKVPANRQTLLFSATMPREIRELTNSLMRNPVSVQVAPVAQTADKIDQSVYFVDKGNKAQLLAHLVNELPMTRAIVFTRTKHGADRVVRHLHTRGIRAEAIHGNKSQNARERALQGFRSGRIPLLIATDIASRGIDVDDITHVVNYDLTHEPETYVHRIGRTARAGASGSAISFCDREERGNLKAIERLIKRTITVREDHPKYVAGPKQSPVAAGPQRHERAEQHRPTRPEHKHVRREQFEHPRPQRAEQPRPQRGERPLHPLQGAKRGGPNVHRGNQRKRRRF